MQNPLRYRILRELRQDIGKYLALFLFLTLTIGFVSGFLVADGSMKQAYDNSFSDYSIEDGHFILAQKASQELLAQLEKNKVTLYELFFKDKETSQGHTIRLYQNRDHINKVCIMKGSLPVLENEIALDRLYAENNHLSVGDCLTIENETFTICGLAAFSDYSALFKNNTDMMFDANKFTVAVVTEKTFESLGEGGLHYCYAWQNQEKDMTKKQRGNLYERLQDDLKTTGLFMDFVTQEENQAIMFTGNDMGSDRVMMVTLLYIVIAILAFVFAVTTKSTIEQEASVIGTLRASGFTKGELLRHYLILPSFVTLFSAILGNLLGYTGMKFLVVQMYYHSYSLPTYETIWNGDAFLLTTIIPCFITFAVNFILLTSLLALPPLQFLRHDLKKKKKKRVINLPNFSFFTRFRIRIIFQNIPAYLTLLIGIILASFLLLFGMMMSPLLSNFRNEVIQSKLSEYQYILKAPVETNESEAENYAVTSMHNDRGEDIMVYGIQPDSKYIKGIDFPKKETSADQATVFVSDGYFEKYHLSIGETIFLEQNYESGSYTMKVAGSYHYPAAMSVFLPIQEFNQIFGYPEDYFSGYFSNVELEDIDPRYIASIITQSDLTIIADQLDDSMGQMFLLICGFSVLLYLLLIYLLAKLVIEKNVESISLIKILGYNEKETGLLYHRTTAIVVIVSLFCSLPISYLLMRLIYYAMMQKFTGWLTFYIAPWIYPAMFFIGLICYFIVYLLQIKKIRAIPMAFALKTME